MRRVQHRWVNHSVAVSCTRLKRSLQPTAALAAAKSSQLAEQALLTRLLTQRCQEHAGIIQPMGREVV
jgi:hypothetical protein